MTDHEPTDHDPTDHDLHGLLERAVDDVPVGAPPLGTIRAEATRARRRRAVTRSLAVAATVAAIASGTALLSNGFGRPSDPAPPRADSPAVTPPAAPAGTRWVGSGPAAIAVPREWGTNQTRCGVPQEDTVVIDVAVIEMCATARPAGVESVDVVRGEPRFDFAVDETLTIDGVAAERQATTCEPAPPPSQRWPLTRRSPAQSELCVGTLYLPSLDVSFLAASSTGPDEVDRLLETISILPGQVGVPGFQGIASRHQENSSDRYRRVLEEAGLTVEISDDEASDWPSGFVTEVSPPPGTMLKAGSTVVVTVSGP